MAPQPPTEWNGLLVDLLLGRHRLVAQEVDGEVELPLLLAVGQHVLDRGDDPFGLQVAAAHSEAAGVELRNFAGLPGGQIRMGRLAAGAAVLQAARDRGPELPHQRRVHRQRLVQTLQHGDALLALQDPPHQVRGEGPEHHHIHDAQLDAAALAQVVGHGLGAGDQASLAQDQVVGVVGPIAHDALVGAPAERLVFLEGAVRQLLDVVEEEGPLGRHALHVGVLVLDQPRHHRIVHVPEQGNAPPGVPVEDALSGSGRLDLVVGASQVLGDQLPLWNQHRLDQVGGQEAVLGHRAGVQGELGDAVGDDVEVGRGLGVLRKDLEEAGVVDAVVVVVPGVHVERGLGHGAGADIEHVGQALSDGRVQGLVHVGNALAGGKVGRAQARHRHSRGQGRGSVLALGLHEDQGPPRDVDVPGGRRLGPVLAHLRGGRDGVGARCVTRLALGHDNGRVSVHGGALAGVLDLGLVILAVAEHRISQPIRWARRGARPCG
jgi:hypothetical protein